MFGVFLFVNSFGFVFVTIFFHFNAVGVWLTQIRSPPNIHGWLSADLIAICRMFCTQEDPIDWSWKKSKLNIHINLRVFSFINCIWAQVLKIEINSNRKLHKKMLEFIRKLFKKNLVKMKKIIFLWKIVLNPLNYKQKKISEIFKKMNIEKSNEFTMCEPMEDAPLICHHDESGTFVHRSYLRVRQNLVMAPLMYQWRIAGIWHDPLDRNYATLARTIESKRSWQQIRK